MGIGLIGYESGKWIRRSGLPGTCRSGDRQGPRPGRNGATSRRKSRPRPIPSELPPATRPELRSDSGGVTVLFITVWVFPMAPQRGAQVANDSTRRPGTAESATNRTSKLKERYGQIHQPPSIH